MTDDFIGIGDLRISSRFNCWSLLFKIDSEVWKMMYAILALVALLVFAGSFYQYRQTEGGTIWMVLALVGIVAAVAFGGLFLSGRVNKKEDIHITE